MIFHKICILSLFLIIVNPAVLSRSEGTEDSIKPKKLSQNLREHIEEISRATNARPQKVKPELKQLINPKGIVQENENNLLRIMIDLRPKTKDSKVDSSTNNLKKYAAEVRNPSDKQEERETSAIAENLKRESEPDPSKPDNPNPYYIRYGTSGANSHVMPGVIKIPNNITGHNNTRNFGIVPHPPPPAHRPNVWAPSVGHPGSHNQPSNAKPTIGTTPKPSTNSTKTTTEISIFIRNATLKDKTEGKILVPEVNHPDRISPEDEKRPPLIPGVGVGDDLCHHCLCSSDMSTVHCIGDFKKRNKVLQKQQISNRVKTLVVRDFDVLEIEPQIFAASNNLNDVTFLNIKSLHLKKESLFFVSKSRQNMKVMIRFHNCYFSQLPTDAITQNVDGRHENRNFFSGEMRRYLSVEFVNCTIGEMQTNSMHRALLYNFYMAKTKISKMSRKSIDLDVKTLAKFEGNDMPSLPTEAICLHSGTVLFLSNRIHSLYNRSIIVEAKSKVSFNGNMFEELHAEALAGIEASTNIYGPSIVFTNNILKRIGSKSFFFGGPFSASSQTILNNTFYTMCSCYIEKEFESFTGTTVHKSSSLKIVFRSSYCIENASATFTLVDNFLSQECSPFPIVTVSAVSVAGILFIIAVTVCVVCSLRVQQVKEEANMLGECTSQSFSTLSRNYPDTLGQPCNEGVPPSPFALVPWGLAFPEVKTYQQNQVPEFTEQTESISGSTRDSLMAHRSEPVTRNPYRSSCPFN